MADNYLYASRSDPFQSFLQGFGAGQNIIGNISQQQSAAIKNQMLQNELTKQQAVKNALASSGQEGFDPAKAAQLIMPHDPALGIQLANMQRSMNKEHIESMASVAKLAETYGPMLLNTPQAYPQFKGMVDKMMPGNMLPGMENFVDQQGNVDTKKYNGFISMLVPDMRKELIKPPTPHFTGMTYGPNGEAYQNVIDPRTLKAGAIPLQGGKEPGTPQLFVDKNNPDNKQWIKPGSPIPSEMVPQSEYKVSLGKMEPEQRQELIAAAKRGDITPSMLSKRGGQDYNALIADMSKEGISLTKLQSQFESAKQFARTMNSQKFVNFYGYASTITNTIDRLATLTDEMGLSGFRPLNYAEIKSKMEMAGNTPQGQLATAYVTQVNGLKEELAQVMNAGYAPTESVWKLVNEQINKNYGVKQMHTALDEVGRLIKYRVNAYHELNPYQLQGNQFNVGQSEGQPSNVSQGSQPQAPPQIPDKVKQMFQTNQITKGQTVDGGDGYLYGINPSTGKPGRIKK